MKNFFMFLFLATLLAIAGMDTPAQRAAQTALKYPVVPLKAVVVPGAGGTHTLLLGWPPSTDTGAADPSAGYNLYLGTSNSGPWSVMNSAPAAVGCTSAFDPSVVPVPTSVPAGQCGYIQTGMQPGVWWGAVTETVNGAESPKTVSGSAAVILPLPPASLNVSGV